MQGRETDNRFLRASPFKRSSPIMVQRLHTGIEQKGMTTVYPTQVIIDQVKDFVVCDGCHSQIGRGEVAFREKYNHNGRKFHLGCFQEL